MELSETWQETISQSLQPDLWGFGLVFFLGGGGGGGRSENRNGFPYLWLAKTFSTFSLQPLTEFNETVQKARYQRPLPSLCYFVRVERKSKWSSCALVDWDIFNFSLQPLQNSKKLDRTQDLNVLYQVWVFLADRKTKLTTLTNDWLKHFRLLLCNRWSSFCTSPSHTSFLFWLFLVLSRFFEDARSNNLLISIKRANTLTRNRANTQTR